MELDASSGAEESHGAEDPSASTGSTHDSPDTTDGMTTSGSESQGETGLHEMCGDGVPHPGEICFGPPQTTQMPFPVFAMLSADLDADGSPEVLVGSLSGRVDVLSGNDRILAILQTLQLSAAVRSLVATDVDGDGELDIVASVGMTTEEAALEVLFNDGEGGLVAITPTHTGSVCLGVAAVDINMDGVMDVLLPERNTGQLHVWTGSQDGSFAWADSLPVGQRPRHVAVSDLNDDGYPDAVVALENCYGAWMDPQGYCDVGELALLFGEDGAGFSSAVMQGVDAYYPDRVLMVDLNLDGGTDVLAIARHCYSAGAEPHCISPARVALLLGAESWLEEPMHFESDAEHMEARGGAVVDVDHDENLDAVFVTNRELENGQLAGNLAVLQAGSRPRMVEVDAGPYAFDAVVADIDGDGAMDVVISNTPDASITVMFGDP